MSRLNLFGIAFAITVAGGAVVAGTCGLWLWATGDTVIAYFGSLTTLCALAFGAIAAINE